MNEAEQLAASAPQPLAGMRLKGKVALVTGAGSAGALIGVGAATSILFAAQGASVGIVDLDPERAACTLAALRSAGGSGHVIEADIATEAGCKAAVAQTLDRFGGLDIVVNNAAIVRPGDVATITRSDWSEVFDVNVTGAMQIVQAAAPSLSKKGGAIVNISSIAAQRGFGSAAYAASKAALEGLTRDMAASLGRAGVRVNCIAPGFLFAPMGGPATSREARREANALGSEGTAWDIAFAALFLASEEARWISGVILPVDGGLAILGPRPR